MEIRFAEPAAADIILQYDPHIERVELNSLILQRRVLLAADAGAFCGWLRYSLFWDNTPFLNMLFVLPEHRGIGGGRQLMETWEGEMERQGYPMLLTSTAAEEYAQHFYHHLGYQTIGGFLLPGEPYEVILAKNLK